jgi:hypothetical protein
MSSMADGRAPDYTPRRKIGKALSAAQRRRWMAEGELRSH